MAGAWQGWNCTKCRSLTHPPPRPHLWSNAGTHTREIQGLQKVGPCKTMAGADCPGRISGLMESGLESGLCSAGISLAQSVARFAGFRMLLPIKNVTIWLSDYSYREFGKSSQYSQVQRNYVFYSIIEWFKEIIGNWSMQLFWIMLVREMICNWENNLGYLYSYFLSNFFNTTDSLHK